jgi:uncharacterized transporter YbjL
MNDQEMKKRKSPPGQFIVLGLCFGAGAGLVFGMIAENLPIGLALGPGIGLLIGLVLDRSNQKNDSA